MHVCMLHQVVSHWKRGILQNFLGDMEAQRRITHLQPTKFTSGTFKRYSTELSWRYGSTKMSLESERGVVVVQCCGSSSSSTSSAEEVVDQLDGKMEMDGKYRERKGQFRFLVREHGWQVRRMVEKGNEMRKVAQVQAEAFHEPVIFFDDLFFQFFQADVLSGLLYRLRNSPPDRYACLIAEPEATSDASEPGEDLVGVVDVTVLRDEDVLQHLPGADEYLYVSGIAVLKKFRRQKVATALLKGCDMLCVLMGYEYLALRAYEDDYGARKLYSEAGYRVVSGDPAWMTSWIGRRRRVLMIKHANPIDDLGSL